MPPTKTTPKPTARKAAPAATRKAGEQKSATKSAASDADRPAVAAEFKTLVNMTPAQIEKFLKTGESTEVGFKKEGRAESVGHASGRRIIEIKSKKAADLSADDYKHMRKVVGYIKRHCAQGPGHKEDVKESKWRYSLMNWGHDPMKGGGCGPAK